MREPSELHGISHLGSQGTEYRSDYAPEVLEAFDNKHPGNDYFVKFVCPEFTSLCPITGQPDFATIIIRSIPAQKMVESKSLQLYLFIEVFGEFTPRGGIAIHPFANYGKPGTRFEELARERLFFHDQQ